MALYICFGMLFNLYTPSVQASLIDRAIKVDSPSEKKVYRIAGEKHLAPFSYIDDAGKFTGFSIDIFKEIAEKEEVEFQYIPMDLHQAVQALQEGKVDAVIGMKYSAEQSERFQFSEPYFTMADAVVVPKIDAASVDSLTDLRGNTIAMQYEPNSFELLLNIRRVEFQLALNQEDALNFLMMGRADALFSNKWTAEYYLKQSGRQEQYTIINNLGVPTEFAAAVQPRETELLSLINRSLSHMQANGEYQKLYAEWFAPSPDEQLKELRNWIIVLIVLISLALLVLWLAYVWNQRLKKEVKKRTHALADANRQLEVQQQAISEANAFKTQIINHMYYGILTFDRTCQLTSINQRAKEMLGLQNLLSIHTNDIHKQPLIQQLFHTHAEMFQEKPVPMLVSDEVEDEINGERRFILYRLIPLYEESRQMNGYLLTLADRSEERKLEKKLATQEKMRALGQLVAGVAHEIRNPLTFMKTFIDLLPKKYEDPAFRGELMKHVPEALNRMNRIVENLLDYARPKYPRKKVFSADPFLQSIAAIIQPTLKKQGIRLEMEIEPDMQLYCDPDQMKQVLLNLMLNAQDAMEVSKEKVLTIQAFTSNHLGWIEVKDTGCGMNQEEMSHLAEPFYTTKPHGVGLGLTLCYQWIKENNGEMNVESKQEAGTVFTVMLPISDEGGEESSETIYSHS
ncbi:polar amino acid transport system substrate-binding protein [Bacillus ectoiniformans]|nr:polar amino acid transport system substrate-binding protein [Bacillus ectoiniformans]